MIKYFKILVCGSREIRDKEFVFNTLDFLLSKKDLSKVILIHGAQKSFDKKLEINYGADYLADLWGKERGLIIKPFPAPWDGIPEATNNYMKRNRFGKLYWPGAGMYRNKQMLEENPDACVGFLSKTAKNSGTKNMLNLCEGRSILVKKYYI